MNDRPSKSARKREYLALQALGEKLIGLSDEQLARIPLDEVLRNAVVTARGIKSRSALRRQRQLIGKLMAMSDPEPIRAAFEAEHATGREQKALFRQAEQWRDRIVREGRPAAAEFQDTLGRNVEALDGILADLAACHDDASRKQVARRLFRKIHGALVSGMQNASS